MAQFIGGEIPTVGTTWQTAVAAPAAAKQREIISIQVLNRDTVTHTIKGRKAKGASQYEFYPDLVLLAGQKGQLVTNAVVLDATDESFEIQSDAVATTTEPIADVAVFEVP